MFALRYLFYLLALALYASYGVVRFVTKPGSRIIVPVIAAIVAVLWRHPLHDALDDWLIASGSRADVDPLLLDALLGLGWLLMTVAYYVASRLLAVVLGAFPPITRPLPPLRRIKPKDTTITPAVVRVVVPPLPRGRSSAPPPWRTTPAEPPPAAQPEPPTRKAAAE